MQDIYSRMKGKKSCGLDSICGYSLKLGFPIIKDELKYLINLSLQKGKFCQSWKKSKIIPIYKRKGSRLLTSQYRPVSNLSEVSKVCEMAVYSQVYNYFESKGLLNPDHHGFMKNKSTVTAIQQLRDYWLRNADDDNYVPNILVGGESISTSKSAKLLGLIIDETYSWFHPLYGDNENIGLIRTLSQRAGILRKIRPYTKPK